MEHRLFLRRRWRVDGRSVRVRPQARHHRHGGAGPGHRVRWRHHPRHAAADPRGVLHLAPRSHPHLHRHLRVRVLLSRAVPPSRCHGVLRRRAVGGIVRAGRRQQGVLARAGFRVVGHPRRHHGGGRRRGARHLRGGDARHFPAVELLRGGRPRRIVRVRGPGLCGKPVAACGCGLRVRRRVPALSRSVYFDWKTSNEADLTPHVARGVGKVRRVVSGVFLHGGDATVAQKERRRRGRWRRNHGKRD